MAEENEGGKSNGGLHLQVTLIDVLYGNSRGPLSRGAFYTFLKKRNCEELLEFWISVQDYLNLYEPSNPRSTYKMNNMEIPDPSTIDRENQAVMQRTLVEQYITDDSGLQINLGNKTVKKILERLPEPGDYSNPPDGLFDEAQAEVEQLLETNYYREFLREVEKSGVKIPRPSIKDRRPPPPKPRPQSIYKGFDLSPPPPPPEEE